jgi:hypothetical protein
MKSCRNFLTIDHRSNKPIHLRIVHRWGNNRRRNEPLFAKCATSISHCVHGQVTRRLQKFEFRQDTITPIII